MRRASRACASARRLAEAAHRLSRWTSTPPAHADSNAVPASPMPPSARDLTRHANSTLLLSLYKSEKGGETKCVYQTLKNMKVIDILGSAASGSKGSTTASRNRGGQYLRNRAIPTNPNSPRQANVREGIGTLTPQWSNVLTQAQRDGWNLYASNVPMIDTLGQTIKISGINQFVRSNAPRLQAGATIILDAPVIFNIGDTPTIITATLDTVAGGSITGTIAPLVVPDSDILLYLGRPTVQGVSYFRSPYRFQQAEQPDETTGDWEITIDADTLVYPIAEGQKVFFRLQSSRGDGRLSADAQGAMIVTTTPP